MKKNNSSQILIIIKSWSIITAIIFSMFFLNSCTECGCTDHTALNYNSTANKNDGSCEYCDTIRKQYAAKTIYLIDFNTVSAHYNQVVAKFIFEQDSVSYNNLSCGENSCLIYLHIESAVNQEMEFNYLVSCNCPLILHSLCHVIIPANTTYNADTVQSNGFPCFNLSSSNAIVNLVNGNIVYH